MFPEELEEEFRWLDAQEALRDFQSFLAADVPVLRIQRQTDVLDWQKLQGVYLNYGERDRLLYVGMTLDCFLNRKRNHDKSFETHFLDLIVFPKKVLFLAPALEVFLRQWLRPILDAGGKHV